MRERAPDRGWDVALDAQNALRASFQSESMQRGLWSFAKSVANARSGPDTRPDIPDDHELTREMAEDAMQIVRIAASTVALGEPIWVGHDVTELIEVAAETYRPQPVVPDDLMIANGFALLPRPLFMLDRRGKRVSFRAVSWSQAVTEKNVRGGDAKMVEEAEGIVVALWSDMTDPDDYNNPDELPARTIAGTPLFLAHLTRVPYGTAEFLDEATSFNVARTLQVMWRLMKQEIVIAGRERVSRPVWRRKSNWRQIKHVTVLTLRRARAYREKGDERDVEWSHRWIVSGHWRAQPYKVNGETVYHQIWIAPYVKGPDDKPFVPKVRAVEFTR